MTSTSEKLDLILARLDAIEAAQAAPGVAAAVDAGEQPGEAPIVDVPPPPEAETHNELVTVEVTGLLAWDGNPDTEGAELYAPAFGVLTEEQREGLYEAGLDDDAIERLPSRFTCPRITAEGLVKARLVTIIEGDK